MIPKTDFVPKGRWASLTTLSRKKEIENIIRIVTHQQSGVVVGGSGMGKSNISGILATRPDLISQLLRDDSNYLFCRVDFNEFSKGIEPKQLYRSMLRKLWQSAQYVGHPIGDEIRRLEDAQHRDDAQSWFFTLEDAHDLVINQAQLKPVWILDRFDKVCHFIDDGILDSLRSLRDKPTFFGNLSYLVFSRKPLQRLRNWENSEFLEIIEVNTCWIGPMQQSDAQVVIELTSQPLGKDISARGKKALLALAGGHPTFLRTGCRIWFRENIEEIVSTIGSVNDQDSQKTIENIFLKKLLEDEQIRRTCAETLKDLEPEELQTILSVATGAPTVGRSIDYLEKQGLLIKSSTLDKKGQVQESTLVFSKILETFLLEFYQQKPHFLSIDSSRRVLLDGVPTEERLTRKETKLFQYLLRNANEAQEHIELTSHLYTEEQMKKMEDPIGAMQRHWANLKEKLGRLGLEHRAESPGTQLYQLTQPELDDDYLWLAPGDE